MTYWLKVFMGHFEAIVGSDSPAPHRRVVHLPPWRWARTRRARDPVWGGAAPGRRSVQCLRSRCDCSLQVYSCIYIYILNAISDGSAISLFAPRAARQPQLTFLPKNTKKRSRVGWGYASIITQDVAVGNGICHTINYRQTKADANTKYQINIALTSYANWLKRKVN